VSATTREDLAPVIR